MRPSLLFITVLPIGFWEMLRDATAAVAFPLRRLDRKTGSVYGIEERFVAVDLFRSYPADRR